VGDKLDALLEETILVAQETKALKRTATKHINVEPPCRKSNRIPNRCKAVSENSG
jgi:hypothetical protein